MVLWPHIHAWVAALLVGLLVVFVHGIVDGILDGEAVGAAALVHVEEFGGRYTCAIGEPAWSESLLWSTCCCRDIMGDSSDSDAGLFITQDKYSQKSVEIEYPDLLYGFESDISAPSPSPLSPGK